MLSRGVRAAGCGLLLALPLPAPVRAQEPPRGQIIDSVSCLADPAQSYALYLPPNYSPDRTWPLLMGFHPGARGRAIVETYRAAAERYGLIVAGSNISRNGSWDVSGRAALAMAEDLGRRFAVNQARVYLTGHSGGARVAMQLALANKAIAGVIASSAGYPDARPRSSVGFPVFGTAGTDDFNYVEMRLLDRALETPHRLVIFEGGHTLPPEPVAIDAVEWLELQAMKAGLREKDDAFLARLWDRKKAAIAAAGESVEAVHLLRALADDFTGLRDVRAEADSAARLARIPGVKRALDRDRDDVNAEWRLIGDIFALEASLRDDALRAESFAELRVLLADTHKKATSAADSPQRDRSRRVLRVVALGAADRVRDAEYLKLLQQYRLPAGTSREKAR